LTDEQTDNVVTVKAKVKVDTGNGRQLTRGGKETAKSDEPQMIECQEKGDKERHIDRRRRKIKKK